MQRRVADSQSIRKIHSMTPTGAPVGSLGEPQEGGGHGDFFQEMLLLINTHWRVRRAGSAFQEHPHSGA